MMMMMILLNLKVASYHEYILFDDETSMEYIKLNISHHESLDPYFKAISLGKMGELFAKSLKFTASEKYFISSINILEDLKKNVLWNEEILNDLAYLYNSYAYLCICRTNFCEAESRLKQAFEAYMKINKDENHPFLINVYYNMGLCNHKQNKTENAMKYYIKCLEIIEKNPELKLDYYFKSIVHINEIDNCIQDIAETDPETAIELSKKKTKIYESLYQSKYHPDLAFSYQTTAMLYKNNSKLDLSLEYFEKAEQVYLKAFNQKGNMSLVALYLNIGSIYYNKGEFQKSIDYYDKAENVFHGEIHYLMIACYLSKSYSLFEQNEFDKAKDVLKQALPIYEELVSKTKIDDLDFLSAQSIKNPNLHSLMVNCYQNIAKCAILSEDAEDSIKYFEKAIKICKKNLKEDKEILKKLYCDMSDAYKISGNQDNASLYLKLAHEVK
jgi:tetratricopeptide (TPR) repeat protein